MIIEDKTKEIKITLTLNRQFIDCKIISNFK